MAGFAIIDGDVVLYDDLGNPLALEPGTTLPTSPRAPLVAGVERGDTTDTVRLLRVDEDGGLVVSDAAMSVLRQLVEAVGRIDDRLETIEELLGSMESD